MEDLAPLIVKAQARDGDAYGRIVRRFQNMAHASAYSLLDGSYLAEDAAQEAFVEAYLVLPNLHDPRAFASWLRRIVFKHCDRFRRRSRILLTPLESVAEVAFSAPLPGEVAERNEMRQCVRDAIETLSENERAVTVLRHVSGYSCSEIACFLEVPVSTVKSRLNTAKRRLQTRMLETLTKEFAMHPLPEDFVEQVRALASLPSGLVRESLPIVVQAAADVLGRSCDYESIQALSTNAFAPCIAMWENETAHWHVFGRAHALDIVGGRLGLCFRRLQTPEESEFAARPKYLKACAGMFRDAMAAGEVVLTEGGFDYREWGIVTGILDDGSIVGVSGVAGRDAKMTDFAGFSNWAMSLSSPSLTEHRDDLAMLDRAAARIRGERSDASDLVFGADAMGLWSAQHRKAPYCYICGGNWCCAHQIARSVSDNARLVATYLKSRLVTFPTESRGAVRTIIGCYESVVELLRPALTGIGGDSCRAFMEDASEREAHAAVILRCADEMLVAAEAMDQILLLEGANRDRNVPPRRTGRTLPSFVLSAWEVANFGDTTNAEMEMLCTLLRANALNGFDRKAVLAQPSLWRHIAAHPGCPKVRWPVPLVSGVTADACFDVARPASPEEAFEFIRQGVDAGQGVIGEAEESLIYCGYNSSGRIEDTELYWITSETKSGRWWTWAEFGEHCRMEGGPGLMGRLSSVV